MKSKLGLVLEGGAMRGMFTAGVTDVLMENGISFDGIIGVSAGAAFGCNIKSGQIGRVIRYNKKYCRCKDFVSISSLIKTGDLYGADFGYRRIPDELDPFDREAFRNDPAEFYVVCTDMNTGRPVYHKCETGSDEDIQWMRASASMPLASRPVVINGAELSDGGTADSVPLRYFESIGYSKNVVILTQPEGFVKKQTKLYPAVKLSLINYPKLADALKRRPQMYNSELRYIKKREMSGDAFVIRPPKPLGINHVEHDPSELERVYQTGRKTAVSVLGDLKSFIGAVRASDERSD
ncbi:MAG: patatin family protein [Oscillospiraceae bacterium]|nr:patatin family protein [Oscillospiraceae bacterium]